MIMVLGVDGNKPGNDDDDHTVKNRSPDGIFGVKTKDPNSVLRFYGALALFEQPSVIGFNTVLVCRIGRV